MLSSLSMPLILCSCFLHSFFLLLLVFLLPFLSNQHSSWIDILNQEQHFLALSSCLQQWHQL
jgi:hypothetical protein